MNDDKQKSQEWMKQWQESHVSMQIKHWPKPLWRWDFAGDGHTLTLETATHHSWRFRLATRIIFGSRWTRLP